MIELVIGNVIMRARAEVTRIAKVFLAVIRSTFANGPDSLWSLVRGANGAFYVLRAS